MRSLKHGWVLLAAMLVASMALGAEPDVAKKKVVLIAGKASHGYGQHEHYAGCMLLAKGLNESGLVEAVVVKDGWPKDAKVLDGASSIVMYCDGGGGHFANQHLPEIAELSSKGVGIACIHYGVEVPKGESGDRFLTWIGGYFEPNWSVNPHWTANFKQLADHPITRGVKPFAINDEWYYHMRFRPDMKGVTPILTDVPPASTMSRPDGPHSGNPAVREEVAAGKPQHMAWCSEREDGGRGFGFTGGHFHWNWGQPDFRRLVQNAILWTAKVDVPADGFPVKALTFEDLEVNQDEKQPENFDKVRISKSLEEWNNSLSK